MKRLGLILLPLTAACADAGGAQSEEARGNTASRAEAGAPAAGAVLTAPATPPADNGVMGAVPGECGSDRAADFAGQIYSAALDDRIREASGASEIRLLRPNDGAPADQALNPRRMNLVLDEQGVILLIDCG